MMSAPAGVDGGGAEPGERVEVVVGPQVLGEGRQPHRLALGVVEGPAVRGWGAPTEGTLFETVGRLPALPVYSPWWKLPEVSSGDGGGVAGLVEGPVEELAAHHHVRRSWQAPPWQVLPGAQSALLKQVTPQAVPWQR
jgi:hypothetical protein